MTPSLAAPHPGLYASTPWIFYDCLVSFPQLEEAINMVHGIELTLTNLPQIKWPMIKELTLVLEPGITNLVSHIYLPSIQQVCIVFLKWCTELLSLENYFF